MDALDTIDLVGGSPFLPAPPQIEKPAEIDTIDLASEEEPAPAAPAPAAASQQPSNSTPPPLPAATSTGNASHQRLCIVLEGTSAAAPHWPRWRSAFIEPFLDRLAGLEYELALILFRTPDGYSDGVLDSSGWTGDCKEFRRWMDSVDFIGGGSGPCALSDALAEVLYLATVPPGKEGNRSQKLRGGSHSKQGMGGSALPGNEDAGGESTTGSGVSEGRMVSHHCWVLAVSDVHRLPISWPLTVGSIEPGRGNIQTLLGNMRRFGLSFSVLSVTRGSSSSNLYKRFFRGLQEAAGGGGSKTGGMESGESENHSWIKLYSLLVDPKWHDGLEFFTAEKQRRSESMISGPSKSSNDIPMGSQAVSSSAMQQSDNTVLSVGASSGPHQYHAGRSPHQIPNPTHVPGTMRIPKQQMPGQPAMVSNPHLKSSPQITSINTVPPEGFGAAQPRIMPVGSPNPGAMHGGGAHSTLPRMTNPHPPPVKHVPNNISPAPLNHPWGQAPQQPYPGGAIQPQVPSPHHQPGIQHHQAGQSMGYLPAGPHVRNPHGMIGGRAGVTGTENEPNMALAHQVGVQPPMQPQQMVGQSVQGMAGVPKPVASTMMHSPMPKPQHFHQSKRQRYTRGLQPPAHMIGPGGHSTQLPQAPGAPPPPPAQQPMYTAWEGPVFIIPQLARTQGVPNVKLFDVQVLSSQQVPLQQIWPSELTIYHIEEVKNFGPTKFYITQRPGTSTEIGDKLVGTLAEKSLAGQIDVGNEHHILVVKVRIKNGQALLLGALMPRTQVGLTVV